MTKTVSTLLLLALAGTAAHAAPVRSARPARPAAPALPDAAVRALKAVPAEAAAPAADAAVAGAPAEVTLYDGKAGGPATPSIADWGGGSGQFSTETYLFGGHSMKVTTLDLFQGARITFPTPVSLAGAGRVFQLTLRRGGATLHYDPRTTSPLPPGDTPTDTNGQFGGRGGFGGPGGFGGQGGRGRGGRRGRRNQGGGQGEAPLIPAITELRLHFTFADGRQSDILRPVPTESDSLAGEGWYSVNIPVSALKLGAGADPLLKSVTVGGDHYGVFFVGRIKLGTDTASGKISITGLDSVVSGENVTLTAAGGSAFSANKYEWDLDEENGVFDQPTGETVSARYFEPGQDHTVTLTVTDLDGVRPPVTITKVIHVKEGVNGPGVGPGGFPGGGPGGGGPGGGGPGGDPGGFGGPGGFPGGGRGGRPDNGPAAGDG